MTENECARTGGNRAGAAFSTARAEDRAPRCSAPQDKKPDPHRLTILTTFGPPATKTLGLDRNGAPTVIEGYGEAARFKVAQARVRSLAELLAVLRRLAKAPRSFVIRGEPLPTTNPRDCRRLLHAQLDPKTGEIHDPTFVAAARAWLALDWDGLPCPAGLDWLGHPELTFRTLARLAPPEFRDAGGVLQATSSAGIRPGIHARTWHLLDRPVSEAEAKRWLAGAPVDRSLYRAVQPHYTAAPVVRGCADPLPCRLWLVPGNAERVPVPDLPEPPPSPIPAPASAAIAARTPYARAALEREAAAVAAATKGERHETLNKAAFKLGRFVATGDLGAGEVARELAKAAAAAGLTDGPAELARFLAYPLRAGAERTRGRV